jgi:3-oxoadipate CoA-transferase beta subunit
MIQLERKVSRQAMAKRVAHDIWPGAVVNLGIGMPEMVGNYIPGHDEVIIHTENGIVGSGPTVSAAMEDFDLINAGRKPVSLLQGGHFVDHADSFAIVRGGHLDITVMGALQVSASGDLANWSTGEAGSIPSPGGAMDLAVGARNVYVMMDLFGKNGQPKLVGSCTFPLTAASVVKRLYTDVAVFDLSSGVAVVLDLIEGVSLSALQELLGVPLIASDQGIAVYMQ